MDFNINSRDRNIRSDRRGGVGLHTELSAFFVGVWWTWQIMPLCMNMSWLHLPAITVSVTSILTALIQETQTPEEASQPAAGLTPTHGRVHEFKGAGKLKHLALTRSTAGTATTQLLFKHRSQWKMKTCKVFHDLSRRHLISSLLITFRWVDSHVCAAKQSESEWTDSLITPWNKSRLITISCAFLHFNYKLSANDETNHATR